MYKTISFKLPLHKGSIFTDRKCDKDTKIPLFYQVQHIFDGIFDRCVNRSPTVLQRKLLTNATIKSVGLFPQQSIVDGNI